MFHGIETMNLSDAMWLGNASNRELVALDPHAWPPTKAAKRQPITFIALLLTVHLCRIMLYHLYFSHCLYPQ